MNYVIFQIQSFCAAFETWMYLAHGHNPVIAACAVFVTLLAVKGAVDA